MPSDLDAETMAEEIVLNQHHFAGLDCSIRPESFAYPCGLASISRKVSLRAPSAHPVASFRRQRWQHRPAILRAMPLVNGQLDTDGIEHAFDEAWKRQLADLFRP